MMHVDQASHTVSEKVWKFILLNKQGLEKGRGENSKGQITFFMSVIFFYL